jgi:hypothetical protein
MVLKTKAQYGEFESNSERAGIPVLSSRSRNIKFNSSAATIVVDYY